MRELPSDVGLDVDAESDRPMEDEQLVSLASLFVMLVMPRCAVKPSTRAGSLRPEDEDGDETLLGTDCTNKSSSSCFAR